MLPVEYSVGAFYNEIHFDIQHPIFNGPSFIFYANSFPEPTDDIVGTL